MALRIKEIVIKAEIADTEDRKETKGTESENNALPTSPDADMTYSAMVFSGCLDKNNER